MVILKTAVMLLMSQGTYDTLAIMPIYFQSMEACEATMSSIVKQAKAVSSRTVNAVCYEEAGFSIAREVIKDDNSDTE